MRIRTLTGLAILYLLGCNGLTAQSKFCWDLYFSQRPTFESNQTTELASLKGIVFPGLAISYTWPFKKATRFDLAQRFVAGSLVNWVKFHAEADFISDGWENSSRMPLLSPFISWGVIGKKRVTKLSNIEIEAFLSPQISFFIPLDYPVSYSMITDSGQYDVFSLFGISGLPIRPIPSIELGFEWVFKKERKRVSSLAISYSFSGFTVGKGKYHLDGTTEDVRGSYKYKANSFIIGINKRY